MEPAVLALASILVGTIGSFISRLLAERTKSQQVVVEGVRLEFSEAVTESLADHATAGKEVREAIEGLNREIRAVQETTEVRLKDDVKDAVNRAVSTFTERLERIEQRFPEESTIDKIASINDAILATKVEQLQTLLEQLEDRILTKWDVATIVFMVIAAVGGLAGVIFAVANFVLK
jgi:hypothetical protein